MCAPACASWVSGCWGGEGGVDLGEWEEDSLKIMFLNNKYKEIM